jgi:nucleoid-associated protein YgaU
MFARLVCLFGLILLVWSVVPRSSEGAGRARSYVVRPGDTLWSIAAARYPGDPRDGIWRIERTNDLAGAAISPGETLVLPP